jgi:methyltransferase (TIGR00027 family)
MFKSIKRLIYKTSDIDAAKDWYEKIIGAHPVLDTPFLVIFKIGECTLSLAKTNSPDHIFNEISETYWEVDEIEDSYQKLLNMGARVHTPLKKVLNIMVAKVIDPFGNIVCITGSMQNEQERTIENAPSETARIAAFSRALTAKEGQGPDHLAEIFLMEEEKRPLIDHLSRKWVIQNLITKPLYGYLKCRTDYIDSIYKSALSGEFSQIVFLGAGYDTRALRFKDLNSGIRIFELDAAATQNRKLETLKNSNIKIPERVSYLEVNFKNENFADELVKSGFDTSLRTLFIWEGVTYYLKEDDIRRTLELINKHAPLGSMVCFDYMTQKIESVNQSEPFLFWMQPEELSVLLSDYGFNIIEHISPSEMEKRFLANPNGDPIEKTLPYFCFVKAAITGKSV